MTDNKIQKAIKKAITTLEKDLGKEMLALGYKMEAFVIEPWLMEIIKNDHDLEEEQKDYAEGGIVLLEINMGRNKDGNFVIARVFEAVSGNGGEKITKKLIKRAKTAQQKQILL